MHADGCISGQGCDTHTSAPFVATEDVAREPVASRSPKIPDHALVLLVKPSVSQAFATAPPRYEA